MRPLVFVVSTYTGWHKLLWLLPERWQARYIARGWLRDLGYAELPETQTLIVQLPGSTWRIIDMRANVEPHGERIHLPTR